jgi:serine/threonine-protein kinase
LSTLPWAVAAIAAVTAIALGIVLWRASRPQPPAPTSRLAVTSGLEGTILDTLGPNALLSPDGSAILFRASNVAPAQLFYRRLDQLRATAITPPENTRDPFFSPDGQWVGYFAAGKLKKVAVSGGASVTLADASGSRGGTWTADGHIIFAPSANSPLMRIAEAGGTPQAITKLEGGEYGHRFPQVLGTGDTLLYTVTQSGGSAEGSTIVLQKLGSDERAVLHRGGYYGRYLTSGHLLLMQGTTLFAARMDLAERRLTTQPVPVIEKVEANPIVGGAQFAVSDTGTLVYLPPGVGGSAIIEWVDRNGNTTPLRKTPGDYYAPRISPDGRRLAVENREGQNDIWIYDWEADRTSRFTFDDVLETYPVWTPDGKRIVFARREQTRGGLFWQRADGTGDSQPLTAIGKDAQPGTNFWSARPLSFHPSGKFLLFEDTADGQRSNIMILPIEGDDASGWKPGKPYSFVSTPFAETEAHFSPDGKWIAYQSDESGTYEIYVRPFGGGEGRWQISNGGGVCPTWSPTSNELFYRATPADRQHLYVASYTATAAVFQAEKPRPLSNVTMVDRGPNRNYDLHPDGKRFAVLRALGADTGSARSQFIMVLNFFDELRRLAP